MSLEKVKELLSSGDYDTIDKGIIMAYDMDDRKVFEDLLEACIVLKGSEIKSILEGKVNLSESSAIEKKGEIVLIHSQIASYKQAS